MNNEEFGNFCHVKSQRHFQYVLLMAAHIPFNSAMKNFHQTLSAHFRFFRYNDQN